ncbi:MAG: hypothetical protein LBH19_14155, partial [Dysgonamonadaceae bacterium]|nr:hypothetical protein [Dysgonamonadaceae bacterium]
MKNIKNIVAICLAALAFSCTDNETSLNLNGDVDIHSFAVNGVEGVINAQTSSITVILPFGTDLTNLAPEITIGDGASITPASRQAIDFSQSALPGGAVTYTVSNGDVYQTYKVAVDVARAKITAFRIGAVEAFSIDEENRTIDIYLPVGTDVSALAPTIEYTEGATITPAAGAQVDFTNPVQYTLVYEGSAFVYTVTVHLGEPPISEIVIYNGEDVAPIWTGIAA